MTCGVGTTTGQQDSPFPTKPCKRDPRQERAGDLDGNQLMSIRKRRIVMLFPSVCPG